MPLACDSLSLDEHFAPSLSQYTDQPAKVQHLSIDYGEHPAIHRRSGLDTLDVLPDLTHLKQLKSLRIDIPDFCKNMLDRCFAKCPVQLESCSIGVTGDDGMLIVCRLTFNRPCKNV